MYRAVVSLEALVLALTTVVRPSSATAVYMMLSTRRPQRLLVAYLVTGLAFSLAVGTLYVLLVPAYSALSRSVTSRAVVDIGLGALALGYAAGTWMGWLHRQPADASATTWIERQLRHLTPPVAALVGVLTHLPGLVYLAALNAIIDSASGPGSRILQVIIYNLLWFSLAVVALVMSVHHPSASRELLERSTLWARRHQRVIIIVFCVIFGLYFVRKGVVELRGAA